MAVTPPLPFPPLDSVLLKVNRVVNVRPSFLPFRFFLSPLFSSHRLMTVHPSFLPLPPLEKRSHTERPPPTFSFCPSARRTIHILFFPLFLRTGRKYSCLFSRFFPLPFCSELQNGTLYCGPPSFSLPSSSLKCQENRSRFGSALFFPLSAVKKEGLRTECGFLPPAFPSLLFFCCAALVHDGICLSFFFHSFIIPENFDDFPPFL